MQGGATSDDVETTPTPAYGEWESIGSVFRSLGSPLRVGIVVLLQQRAHTVNQLVEALGVSQPLVSQHLRVLRSSGLVYGERRGREMIYHLSDQRVSSLVVSAGRHAKAMAAS